ncbi:MAG: polyphosphate kinase 1 [Spirochaetaceae bacterium]
MSVFFNRELSWIEFNARVLEEAGDKSNPLIERLKFISIVSSNFDEFFMVRVASLKRQYRRGNRVSCPSGMSPSQQLSAISKRVKELVGEKYRLLHEELFPALKEEGISLLRPDELTGEQEAFLHALFMEEIFPLLTPVRCKSGDELPYIGNLRLHAAFLLKLKEGESPVDGAEPGEEEFAVVQIPPSVQRIIYLPTERSRVAFTLLEYLVVSYAHLLFPGYEIRQHAFFRLTRDADMSVDEERDEDFVEAMEQVLESREHSRPVRLTVNGSSEKLKALLQNSLELTEEDVYEKPEPLDVSVFMEFLSLSGFDHLKDPPWRPQEPAFHDEDTPLWDTIRRRDVLLHHPYDSFEPVVELVRRASEEPETLSIKITLYRTSGDSPIIRALEEAANRGKQVTAVVELKARFDEEQNIGWATRLERAGVIVVYGIARLKIHAKALLIVRKERSGVRRYLHLATGNYNDKTAKLYTDYGFMTSREELTYEAGLVFNAITGYSAVPSLKKLLMAPVSLKAGMIQRIEREASRARSSGSGLILAKCNAIADPEVIQALYEASQAGVRVRLNIRGICMLVPGVEGLSENIEVVSIVDRFLEHSRIYYFQNGGNEELFLSSADWMPRNLERRVELAFPVEDADLKQRLIKNLEVFFSDNVKARVLQPDGSWVKKKRRGDQRRAQEIFQNEARSHSEQVTPEEKAEFRVRRKPPE